MQLRRNSKWDKYPLTFLSKQRTLAYLICRQGESKAGRGWGQFRAKEMQQTHSTAMGSIVKSEYSYSPCAERGYRAWARQALISKRQLFESPRSDALWSPHRAKARRLGDAARPALLHVQPLEATNPPGHLGPPLCSSGPPDRFTATKRFSAQESKTTPNCRTGTPPAKHGGHRRWPRPVIFVSLYQNHFPIKTFRRRHEAAKSPSLKNTFRLPGRFFITTVPTRPGDRSALTEPQTPRPGRSAASPQPPPLLPGSERGAPRDCRPRWDSPARPWRAAEAPSGRSSRRPRRRGSWCGSPAPGSPWRGRGRRAARASPPRRAHMLRRAAGAAEQGRGCAAPPRPQEGPAAPEPKRRGGEEGKIEAGEEGEEGEEAAPCCGRRWAPALRQPAPGNEQESLRQAQRHRF